MYFVLHFGHAKVYETYIWTPYFQILAKTMISDMRSKIGYLKYLYNLNTSISLTPPYVWGRGKNA